MDKLMDRSADIGPFVPLPDDDLIVCRCEEITKEMCIRDRYAAGRRRTAPPA